MSSESSSGPVYLRGNPITIADLPPAGIRRWTAYRKVILVNAVRYRLISLEDALKRYRMSREEFREYERAWLNGEYQPRKSSKKD
jgi:hypothetical protein